MPAMAAVELEGMRAGTRGGIAAAHAELESARRLAALYRTTVLPQAGRPGAAAVRRRGRGAARDRRAGVLELYEAVMEGAVDRVRPKMMTVASTMIGLLPILWAAGTGASVMKRVAAPMIGGMLSSTLLTLLVIPAIWSIVRDRELQRERRRDARRVAAGRRRRQRSRRRTCSR